MDRKCQPFGRQSSLLADTLPGQSWEHDRETFDSTTLENWTSLKKKGIKSQFFLYDKSFERLFKKRFRREFFNRSFFDRFLIILKISGQIFTLERRSCSGKIFYFSSTVARVTSRYCWSWIYLWGICPTLTTRSFLTGHPPSPRRAHVTRNRITKIHELCFPPGKSIFLP